MALSGQSEGTVEIYLDSVDLVGRQVLKKEACRLHRTYCVRARGTDPNLEEIKDAGAHREQAGKEGVSVSKKLLQATQQSVTE